MIYTKVPIKITRNLIFKGDKKDALNSPVALAIKELLFTGDVLVTAKKTIYYSKSFDRTDHDMVLGKYRLAIQENTEELKDLMRLYEDSGNMIPCELNVLIPQRLLLGAYDDTSKRKPRKRGRPRRRV